jgi:[ribosomal protein S5]-alanine N-acetyltransferase
VQSERLRYRRLEAADLQTFHALTSDPHVRRYMMDGQLVPLEACAERLQQSERLFAERGVGTWLAYEKATTALVGFCGFELTSGEPYLMYALTEAFSGRGYASEMARAAIAVARAQPGFETISADVDEINAASLHVLEKLGFERVSVHPGAFGNLLVLRLGPPS